MGTMTELMFDGLKKPDARKEEKRDLWRNERQSDINVAA